MYLLDTNVLSEFVRKSPSEKLVEEARRRSPEALTTSCVCVMELRHGAVRTSKADALWSRIESLILKRVLVLEIRIQDAILAGDILANLWSVGKPIKVEDVLIAASALSRGFTVVTRNVSHFGRIPGLKVEDWMDN